MSRLQESITNKEKMARNFDETENLYLEKIKTLQQDKEQVEESLATNTDRWGCHQRSEKNSNES